MSRKDIDLTPLLEACRAEERERLRKLVEEEIKGAKLNIEKAVNHPTNRTYWEGYKYASEFFLSLLESKQ